MNLKINKLNVLINDKKILDNINFSCKSGDVIAIIGPNGQGKSTILKSIVNHYSINKNGKIYLNNDDISNLSPNEIAQKGIFYCSQNPVEIPGISTLDLYKSILNAKHEKPLKIAEMYLKINKNLKKLHFSDDILQRSVNEGFSGGEKKKNEIAQMLLMEPEVILLDEIDSGLDVDVFNNIMSIVKEQISLNKIIIFITHNKKMIDILNPNIVLLISNGKIVKESDISLANQVFDLGFKLFFSKNNITLKTEKKLLENCGIKYEKNKNTENK